jgi:hypothetical protein
MPSFASVITVLLLTGTSGAVQGATVVLSVRDPAALTLRELTIAKNEIDAIWSHEGVQIRWGAVGLRDIPEIRIDVAFERAVNRSSIGSGGMFALAATKICESVPTPAITVILAAVEHIVRNGMSAEQPDLTDSTIIRETLVGRVIGRSIAHEIGHILLRSSDHGRQGLMRPQFTSTELIADDMTGFRLSTDDRQRLGMLLRVNTQPSLQCGAP